VTVAENGDGDWTITYTAPVMDVPEIVVEDDSLSGGSTIDLTETTPGVAAVITLTETTVGVSSEDALWSAALII